MRPRFLRFLLLLSAGSLAATSGTSLQERRSAEEKRSYFDSRILRVALEQAEKKSGFWDPAQRDCSGFVRFVYYRSLGSTAKKWKTTNGKFDDYASAGEMIQYNFTQINREVDPSQVKSGDLLAFYSDDKEAKDRWHLMLVLKSPYSARNSVLLIYHNGAEGEAAAVRKVELSELMKVPGGEWIANSRNPRFRGVYRWNGWEALL